MGEAHKAETFQAPKPEAHEMPADKAAQIAQDLKVNGGAYRGVASSADKTAPEERPAWLPTKFKSAEDMAKAYAELEKKQGGSPAPAKAAEPAKGTEGLKVGEPAKATTEVTPQAATADQTKAAEEVVSKAGLDMTVLSQEYAQKGELSAESLKKLESVGITKEVVNTYIEGQKAIQAARMSDLESVAGGHEQFAQMHAWSAQNLSDPEKVALNKVIETGNHEAIKNAFTGIYAKYSAAGQAEPTGQIRGEKANLPGDVYTHMDEMKADMRKPEYKTNQVFRDKVMAKLARSSIR